MGGVHPDLRLNGKSSKGETLHRIVGAQGGPNRGVAGRRGRGRGGEQPRREAAGGRRRGGHRGFVLGAGEDAEGHVGRRHGAGGGEGLGVGRAGGEDEGLVLVGVGGGTGGAEDLQGTGWGGA